MTRARHAPSEATLAAKSPGPARERLSHWRVLPGRVLWGLGVVAWIAACGQPSGARTDAATGVPADARPIRPGGTAAPARTGEVPTTSAGDVALDGLPGRAVSVQ